MAQVTIRTTNTSVSAPSGWTMVRQDNIGGTAKNILYYRVASASEPDSYRWTFGKPQQASGGIMDYAGVDTGSPIDAHSGQYNSGTTATAPSVNLNTAGAKVVYVVATASQTSVNPPSGFTTRYSAGVPGAVMSFTADKSFSSAGATGNQDGTAGTSNVAVLVALRPAQ